MYRCVLLLVNSYDLVKSDLLLWGRPIKRTLNYAGKILAEIDTSEAEGPYMACDTTREFARLSEIRLVVVGSTN